MTGSVLDRASVALDEMARENRDLKLVACSGGGDSIALLHIAVQHLGRERVAVATVNHHLRDVSEELALVRRHADSLDVPHEVLDWHWEGRGNLQAAARDGRRALLERHAEAIGADLILLGHTRDDQAETFLLRLARGSGVDGLAAMQPVEGMFARPLIGITRAELRDFLVARGLAWAEDPSNDDLRFDRVRARAMMGHLAELGLTRDRLVATAERMAAERQVLVEAARDFGRRHTRTQLGDVVIEADAFHAALPSLKTRALAGIVGWFANRAYKPRAVELDRWMDRIASGKPAPLGGVLAVADRGEIRFYREPAAVAEPVSVGMGAGRVLWDNRWIISHTGSHTVSHTDCHIAALGDALSDFDNWRALGLPRASMETSPALWREDHCISALCLDPPEGWSVRCDDWWRSLG